jgi:hypothetical protein
MSDPDVGQVYEGVEAPNPGQIDETKLQEIIAYLVDQDDKESKAREALEARVMKWRRQREAVPEKERKDTPWPGASNVATPATAIATNGNHSFLRSAFAMRDPFLTVTAPHNVAYIEHAAAMTEYFSFLCSSRYHLNLEGVLDTILYTACSEGVCFVKVPWLVEHWQFKGKDSMGNVRQISATIHDGPSLIPIPFEDFLIPAGPWGIQDAPWIRHRVFLPWHTVNQRAANGIYQNVELIKDSLVSVDDIKQADAERIGIDASDVQALDMREYHVFWDMDDDGIEEDIIVTINWDTKQWVRVDFNDIGIRDVIAIPYGIRPNSPYKIGVGWWAERLQDEIDTHRNYRVDGMILANLRMLVAKRNAGLSPKEKLWPGKILFMDNPREDITVLQFGEVYGSSLAAEMTSKQDLERVTTLSNYSIGATDPNNKYVNTSGMMFLNQQGGQSKSAIVESIATAFSEMGQIVMFQIIRNKDRVNLDQFDEKKKALISEVLNMNVEDIPTTFSLFVKTTDINQTKEAQRQSVLTLTQLYAAYFKDITQTLMMAMQPQVPQEIKAFSLRHYTGASRMMEKVLKFFGEDDTEKFLPDFRKIEQLLDAMNRQLAAGGGAVGGQIGAGGMGSQPGGGFPAPGAGGVPGMGGGPQALGGAPQSGGAEMPFGG